jgi:hypothetical protein
MPKARAPTVVSTTRGADDPPIAALRRIDVVLRAYRDRVAPSDPASAEHTVMLAALDAFVIAMNAGPSLDSFAWCALEPVVSLRRVLRGNPESRPGRTVRRPTVGEATQRLADATVAVRGVLERVDAVLGSRISPPGATLPVEKTRRTRAELQDLHVAAVLVAIRNDQEGRLTAAEIAKKAGVSRQTLYSKDSAWASVRRLMFERSPRRGLGGRPGRRSGGTGVADSLGEDE